MSRRRHHLRVRLTRNRHSAPGVLREGPLVLPVALGEFTVTEEALHSEYDTVGAGQFSTPSGGDALARQLRTLGGLETLTIDWEAPWLTEWRSPRVVKRELTEILRSKKPVTLLATIRGRPDEVRMNVTLRSLSRTLRPGEADTRYWSIDVMEWRQPRAGDRREEGDRGARGVSLPRQHRLSALGDESLRDLARRYYGNEAGWRAIAGANGIRNFGSETPLYKHAKFKRGSRVKIPLVPPRLR